MTRRSADEDLFTRALVDKDSPAAAKFRHHLDAFNEAHARKNDAAARAHSEGIERALEAYEKELGWFMLRFYEANEAEKLDAQIFDGRTFIGMTIVRGSSNTDAIRESWDLKANPGSNVLATLMTADQMARVPADCRNRLLRKDELVARGLMAPPTK
jgi:hypothetical protein